MANIPAWAIIAFFIFDSIVMIGVVVFVLSRRNQSPPTYTNPGAPSPWNSSLNSTSSFDESEVRRLIQLGQKIPAIKLVREHTGLGLKEAKDAVEELERRMR